MVEISKEMDFFKKHFKVKKGQRSDLQPELAKLKQDLYHLWSLKVQEEKTLRLIQIYRYIWEKLSKRYEKYINTKEFEILDAMNIIRIEPYLTNDNQRIILDTIVKSTKLYEKFDYSNGRKI